jgi:hypothetical protein
MEEGIKPIAKYKNTIQKNQLPAALGHSSSHGWLKQVFSHM